MTRILTSLAFALAAVSTSRVAADEKFEETTVDLAYQRPSGDGPICIGVTFVAMYPSQPVEGASLVINVTAIDTPAGAIVRVRDCDSASNPALMNASDPATWLAAVSGQCALIWLNNTETPLNCSNSKVTAEYSLLSDYCERSPSAEVCRSSKAPSSQPVPAPSSAMPQTAGAWAVATTALTAMALSLVDL
ncbi:hypothetical protein Poli38472_009335 [Pythium oligandrum]|uniref:Uncharacterized protein n=1 Tax=Pythium oligandrum TaxID=41045 RepID=A0A8K1CMS1_PYTOL|nr:hypothetical protein Poli38472_009335 [Pythium oligandrum]|eukprot:TMW65168.1 hypothetical protein Poli38472_009335 [Pythium oligandrum]